MGALAAGSLDRRLTIQARTDTPDPVSNEPIPGWAPVATVWCSFAKASPGREPFTSDQFAAFADSVFQIRYSDVVAGVVPKTHRLIFEGRTYDIVGVTQEARREHLEITGYARANEDSPRA